VEFDSLRTSDLIGGVRELLRTYSGIFWKRKHKELF
jgi:hypothetical protein